MQDTIASPIAATDLADVPQPMSTARFPGPGALLVSRAAAAAIALAGAGMAAAPNHPAPNHPAPNHPAPNHPAPSARR